MALPINIDEKAYLASIGKELDEGGKKDGKQGNDFLKDCTKDCTKEITDKQRITLKLISKDCTITSEKM